MGYEFHTVSFIAFSEMRTILLFIIQEYYNTNEKIK